MTVNFVELESGARLHAISLVRTTPFRRGEEIAIHTAPRHCRLLDRRGNERDA